MRALLLTLLLVAPTAASAGKPAARAKGGKDRPTLTFRPAESDGDERPLITELVAGPQGSDIALRVTFTKEPWGEGCQNRCANATLLLDTDHSPSTGLQLGAEAETGADLAVTIQGVREYKESTAESRLKVRVRFLSNDHATLEQGSVLADLDLRMDRDRVHVDGNVVSLIIDATDATLPSGKTMRVVYHPPGAKAVTGLTAGMLASGTRRRPIVQMGR